MGKCHLTAESVPTVQPKDCENLSNVFSLPLCSLALWERARVRASRACLSTPWSMIALLTISILFGVANAAQRELKEVKVDYPPSMASVTLMNGSAPSKHILI